MLISDFRKPTVPSAEHRTRFIFASKTLYGAVTNTAKNSVGEITALPEFG